MPAACEAVAVHQTALLSEEASIHMQQNEPKLVQCDIVLG